MNELNPQMAWYDQVTPVWQEGADARASFIARTYSHLIMAIAAFIGIEVFLFTSGWADKIAEFVFGISWLLVIGGFMIVGMLATKLSHASRSKPAQYAALFGFVAAEALVFVPILWIANQYAPGVIEKSALVASVGFLGLTAIAFYTRKDFSFLRSILMWAGFAALALIVGSVIFGFSLGAFFAVLMVALAGASILYDTSNVLHHYPADMHVGAALSLFASVAMLFYYVISFFLSIQGD